MQSNTCKRFLPFNRTRKNHRSKGEKSYDKKTRTDCVPLLSSDTRKSCESYGTGGDRDALDKFLK